MFRYIVTFTDGRVRIYEATSTTVHNNHLFLLRQEYPHTPNPFHDLVAVLNLVYVHSIESQPLPPQEPSHASGS